MPLTTFTIPVIMSEAILNKIKYLCKSIPKVEWSGVLFYSVKGSIANPKDLELILEDILPLDMGTAAYTEYELDSRFVEYLMDNPEAMEWNVGHIHSHNVMGVFFSGTDNAELNDNAPSHNYYLSLIVNNYMDFVAKVAFVGSMEQSLKQVPYYAQDENGKQYIIENKDVNLKKDKLFVYDCIITSPVEEIMVENGFADKVKEIMKPKPLPATYTKPVYQNPVAKPGATNPNFNPSGQVQKAVSTPVTKTHKAFPKVDVSKLSKRGKTIHDIAEKIPFTSFDDLSQIDAMSPMEKFAAELMNFTSPLQPDENLEDVLTVLEDMNMDAYEIATSVVSNCVVLYDKYFPDADDKEFIEDMDDVVSILEDELPHFPFINVTIEALKSMVLNFENNGAAAVQ